MGPQSVAKWEQNLINIISGSSKKVGERPEPTSGTDWSELHLSNSQNDGSEAAQRGFSGVFLAMGEELQAVPGDDYRNPSAPCFSALGNPLGRAKKSLIPTELHPSFAKAPPISG